MSSMISASGRSSRRLRASSASKRFEEVAAVVDAGQRVGDAQGAQFGGALGDQGEGATALAEQHPQQDGEQQAEQGAGQQGQPGRVLRQVAQQLGRGAHVEAIGIAADREAALPVQRTVGRLAAAVDRRVAAMPLGQVVQLQAPVVCAAVCRRSFKPLAQAHAVGQHALGRGIRWRGMTLVQRAYRGDQDQSLAVLGGRADQPHAAADPRLVAGQGAQHGLAARAGGRQVQPERQIGQLAVLHEQQRIVHAPWLQRLEIAERVHLDQPGRRCRPGPGPGR